MIDRRSIVTGLGALATSTASMAAQTRGKRTSSENSATNRLIGAIYADDYAIDPSGLTDSAPGINLAIQDAITQKKRLVLPAGIFLLNSPLLCFTSLGSAMTKLDIEGQGGALPQMNSGFPTLPLASYTANTILCMNSKALPALIYQGARSCTLRNIGIVGLNSLAFYSPARPTDSQSDYILSGCRNSAQSPYCGIAIDPFTAAPPADGGYPGMSAYYGPPPSGRGSSEILVENVWITQFVVGIALSTAGNNQGDLMTFRNLNIQSCDTAFVCGNSQSRNCMFLDGNINWCRQAFDTLTYGAGTANPCNPIVSENTNFVEVNRLFALNNQTPCLVKACYAESIKTLGQFGKTAGGNPQPISFIGDDWHIRDTWGSIPPLLFESYSPTVFKSCNIENDRDVRDAWNVIFSGAGGSFEQCSFTGSPHLDLPPYIGIDFNSEAGSHFTDCFVSSTPGAFPMTDVYRRSYGISFNSNGKGRLRATWQTRTVTDGNLTYNYQPYLPVPYVVCKATAQTIMGSTLSFVASTLGEFLVDDILLWLMHPQGYSGVQWNVPAWKITSVNASTGACVATALYDVAQYDTIANNARRIGTDVLLIAVHQWAPTQRLTGNTATDATLTAVTPAALINGDWVIGTGIPANTRVVSGGGTASVVLSKATTATATGVTLYYGRLLVPATTVAF